MSFQVVAPFHRFSCKILGKREQTVWESKDTARNTCSTLQKSRENNASEHRECALATRHAELARIDVPMKTATN